MSPETATAHRVGWMLDGAKGGRLAYEDSDDGLDRVGLARRNARILLELGFAPSMVDHLVGALAPTCRVCGALRPVDYETCGRTCTDRLSAERADFEHATR